MDVTEREFLAALGARLRVVRAARGMSQRDVAAASGIHRTIVGQIERGQINFGIDRLRRLAQALDISAAFLVPTSTVHIGVNLMVGDPDPHAGHVCGLETSGA